MPDPAPPGAGISLVLGGARSGKSAFAEGLVERLPGDLVYLATGTAVDADMGARIAAHRQRRGPRYTTVDAGAGLTPALERCGERAVLIDALGTWVAAHHDFVVDVDGFIDALAARRAPTVIVSDEVGLGVHPASEVGRAFRDALGLVNQRVAAVAGDVWLVVAGRGLRLEAP